MALFGKYDVILAPMAGLTDKYTRSVCSSLGADLTFSEMVSSKGLQYKSKKTKDLIELGDGEGKIGVQIFGNEPATMAAQAAMIEEYLGNHLAYIDINMGCPARKITSKGDGAALIKDPDLACEITKSVKSAISVPLTVKTRRGFYEGSETCVDFAKRIEDAGADAICVHGRFAEQFYRGTSDTSCIERVVSSVSIPVIGNGDIRSVSDYVEMKERTCCEAVMIARAAISNPLLFTQIKDYIATKKFSEFNPQDRMQIAIKHARLIGDDDACNSNNLAFFRKHAMCYVEGLRGAKVARSQICESTTPQDFIDVFTTISEVNKNAA